MKREWNKIKNHPDSQNKAALLYRVGAKNIKFDSIKHKIHLKVAVHNLVAALF